MSFTWQTFAELASELASEADEARQRTAVNRAYYAAYHAASAYVRVHDLCAPQQHLTHSLVWRLIRGASHSNSEEIGRSGDALRRLRVMADYQNPFPRNLNDDVPVALSEAAAIVSLLRETQPATET
jgi:uncharacterized protein (UPF0332 family)